jgi:hypothetical protein
MSELQWFRLFLVTAAAFVVIAGGTWLYNTSQVQDAKHRSQLAYEACQKTARTIFDCSDSTSVTEETWAQEERAELAFWVTWLPPLGLALLFYGVRWALTGRVRPLWLLRKETS